MRMGIGALALGAAALHLIERFTRASKESFPCEQE